MERELLESLDWLVVRCSFENRAEAIRAAIRTMAANERDREVGEQIAEGYRRIPQTEEEIAGSRHNDWSDLPDDAWEDWL